MDTGCRAFKRRATELGLPSPPCWLRWNAQAHVESPHDTASRTVFVGGFGAGVAADGDVDGVVIEAGYARPPRHLLIHVAAAGQVRPDRRHNRVRPAKVLRAMWTTLTLQQSAAMILPEARRCQSTCTSVHPTEVLRRRSQ